MLETHNRFLKLKNGTDARRQYVSDSVTCQQKIRRKYATIRRSMTCQICRRLINQKGVDVNIMACGNQLDFGNDLQQSQYKRLIYMKRFMGV